MSNLKKLITSLSPQQRGALFNELAKLASDISRSGLSRISGHVTDRTDDQDSTTYWTGFSHGTFDAVQVVQDEMTRVRYMSNEVERQEARLEEDSGDKPNHFVDEEFLAKWRKKLYHGLPLTVEEQRELWQQASGEWLERKGRRCPVCGGSGLRRERDGLTITGDPRVELLCNRCNGDGYVSRETQKGK